MAYEREIELLDSEWSMEEGFFWHIREGHFDPVAFKRALHKVSSIQFPEDATLPRRIVSYLWYIPLFMQWQTDRVKETGGDATAYGRAVSAMTNEIERLLGVP